MKKNLLLFATLFYTIATIVIPLAGFALLEPSTVNLLFISWFFVLSAIGGYCYCDLWLKERRKQM
jgi:hypothetical protein